MKDSPYSSYREKYRDERVLIVDDNPTAREILSLYLSELGFQVEEAGDGESALEKLKNSVSSELPFSFCVIDQIMPRMDGWHLASEINALRDQPEFSILKELKLYLVSPAGRSADEAKMKLLNWFEGYLNKPLKKHQLYSVFAGMNTEELEEEPLELLPVDEEDEFSARVKAMVAEDHEVNQQLFRSILENLGCDVVVASNGREAVELCNEGEPDLIFMDCQMPEMNGYEATEAIRRGGFNMPIIAVTASAIKGEREKCIECGMTDFLTKPFKKKDIQPMLNKWKNLNHDGSSSASSAADETTGGDTGSVNMENEQQTGRVFDFDEAVETFMGNEETVRKLVSSYIGKVEGQIPAISGCLEAGDTDGCRELAHSIKGSALNLSMEVLGEAAKELEYSSRDGELEASKSNFSKLKLAFSSLKEYVSENGYL